MKRKAKDIISKYHLSIWQISPEQEFEIEFVNARQFLKAERIDLICKLYYIDCKIKKKDMKYALELYSEHIRAFSNGSFVEPGNETKNTLEKYLSCFDSLIADISQHGINEKKSIVPVGENNVILDGSHRVAIAIYFDIKIPIVRINYNRVNYNYDYFLYKGLNNTFVDDMIIKYMSYVKNVFLVCLWPAASSIEKNRVVEEIITHHSEVVYKKQLYLNYHALEQLLIHAYGHQSWTGDYMNGFQNITGKVNSCYCPGVTTKIYIIDHITFNQVLELKEEIRNLYGIGNHSIHITDTLDESLFIARVAFNKNSIDMLSYGNPFKYPEFSKKY